jgi:hypothetical protein
MYVNANMIPVETIPGIGGRSEFKLIYLRHCKNFCKGRNVPPPSTRIEKKDTLM